MYLRKDKIYIFLQIFIVFFIFHHYFLLITVDNKGGNEFDFTTGISANTTLYAHWSANSYTLTINSNVRTFSGGLTSTDIAVMYDSTLTADMLGTPTRDGFEFIGWADDSAATSPNVSLPIEKWNETSNVTYFAVWREITYTVKLYIDGVYLDGNDITVSYNSSVIIPDNVVEDKVGYTFNGWFTDSTLTTLWDMTKIVSTDMNLYAVWESNIQDSGLSFKQD